MDVDADEISLGCRGDGHSGLGVVAQGVYAHGDLRHPHDLTGYRGEGCNAFRRKGVRVKGRIPEIFDNEAVDRILSEDRGFRQGRVVDFPHGAGIAWRTWQRHEMNTGNERFWRGEQIAECHRCSHTVSTVASYCTQFSPRGGWRSGCSSNRRRQAARPMRSASRTMASSSIVRTMPSRISQWPSTMTASTSRPCP